MNEKMNNIVDSLRSIDESTKFKFTIKKPTDKSSAQTVIPNVDNDDLKVKDWFLEKVDMPHYAMSAFSSQLYYGGFTVVETTEKAAKVEFEVESANGERTLYLTKWIPKSAFESIKDYKKNEKAKQDKYDKALEEGKKKYEALLAFAKDNKVKGVRKGMRKETILKKIEDAGLQYEY